MNFIVHASLDADEAMRALRRRGWFAMSYEELVVRRHYDFLGNTNGPKPSSVDWYHLDHLFMQLGICESECGARKLVVEVIQRLVDLGFLRTSSYGEGPCTSLAQPKLSLNEAVTELRQKLEENRA